MAPTGRSFLPSARSPPWWITIMRTQSSLVQLEFQ